MWVRSELNGVSLAYRSIEMVPVAEAMTRCISSVRGTEADACSDDDDDEEDDAVVVLPLLSGVVDDLLLLLLSALETDVPVFFAAAVVAAFPFFPFFVVTSGGGGSSFSLAPSDTSILVPFNPSAILSSTTLLSDVQLSTPLIPTCHQKGRGRVI